MVGTMNANLGVHAGIEPEGLAVFKAHFVLPRSARLNIPLLQQTDALATEAPASHLVQHLQLQDRLSVHAPKNLIVSPTNPTWLLAMLPR